MSTTDSGNQSNPRSDNTTSSAFDGVSDMVNAAFEIGSSVARVFAQATSLDKPLEDPPAGDSSVSKMVYYGTTTIGNVVRMVFSGLSGSDSGNGNQQGGNQPGGNGTNQGTPEHTMPSVGRGSTLRMPLSIENRGNEPMEGMVFVCLSMNGKTTGPGTPLNEASVRFQPARLDVPPNDFEKLTIFIDTALETAPGTYEATIALGPGIFENRIAFEVRP